MLDVHKEEKSDSVFAPALRTIDVMPDDEKALPIAAKALYIGTGGDVVLRALGDSDFRTFKNLPSGSTLAVRVAAIKATGTTASDIVGLY
jgi:vacuolar-type H+-ATPase subunit B/Vma2